MSAKAVLDTVYTTLARRADAADDRVRMFGHADEAVARETLDRALDLIEDDEGSGEMANVVELRAWVQRVNDTMK